MRLIRFDGHLPKGGYDGQNEITQWKPVRPATVFRRVPGGRCPARASTVKSELPDRFDSCGEAKMELFDCVEVFYNQRRQPSARSVRPPSSDARRLKPRE